MLGVSWFRLDALSVSGMSRMIVGLVKIRSKLELRTKSTHSLPDAATLPPRRVLWVGSDDSALVK